VLLEAMAARTPVVASDLTGYRHVARPDREALMVEPGSADALRAALRRLLDEPEVRAHLVEGGAVRAEEFSMARLATAFVDRYEVALTRGRRPAEGPSGP
jgi:glycosyltransferase involved in cell wall biosynthesis